MMLNQRIVASGHDIWKIFGNDAHGAFRALRSDEMARDAILRQYGAIIGVAGVDFEIYSGEILCIMGLSGSGKSTLMRHINRLIEPTGGRILIDGQDINKMTASELRALRATKVSMVFQNPCLFPHWSIAHNVAYGLEVQGLSRSKRLAIAREFLELVHLGDWADRFPSELSGGMQQRVGIARALANDPSIILMDEPFSALDPLIRRQLQTEFLRIWRTLNKSALFITHDLDEAIRIGDRIAIMKEGRFVQIGTPEDIVTNPRDDYVREFVRGISKLEFVKAHTIMSDPNAPVVPVGERTDERALWQRVGENWSLDRIISCKMSVRDSAPLIVEDADHQEIGIITMRDIISGIQSR